MAKRNKGIGAYTSNNPGLVKRDWTNVQGEGPAKKSLEKNVNRNSDEARGGFAGAIKYGTDND